MDADACPAVVREILNRAADRTRVSVTYVTNQNLALPRVPGVTLLRVPHGFDVADREIAERCRPGDLVITADIPLAAEVIERGCDALNPRGERYSADTIRGLLGMRDFMDTMRASGVTTSGPPPMGTAERNRFASHLDQWLHRRRQPAAGEPR